MTDFILGRLSFDNFMPFMEELRGRILLSSNWVNVFRSLDKQKAGAHFLSSRIPEIMIPCFISVAFAEKHGISVILLLWCFLRSLIFFFFFHLFAWQPRGVFKMIFMLLKWHCFPRACLLGVWVLWANVSIVGGVPTGPPLFQEGLHSGGYYHLALCPEQICY